MKQSGTFKALTRARLAKVNVVGTSGGGKSTFAKKLAAKLGHPVVEMDELFWLPNWTEPKEEVFFPKLAAALSRSKWVLDGNYDRTLSIKWKDVTAVVWIDYSFCRTILQAIRRALVRSIHRKELWPGTGNRESFRKSFLSRGSIIIWTLKTFHRNRERYEKRATDPRYTHIHFFRLKNPTEARKFLESIDDCEIKFE